MYLLAGGQHQWYNAPSGAAGDPITFTQAMTLDASGHLLVGLTSSINASGAVQAGGFSDTRIVIDGSSNQGIYFTKSGADNGTFRVTSGGNYEWLVKGSGTANMTLDVSGNLLLGTTSPDAPLAFKGVTGKKISLYSGSDYSIGVESSEFRIATSGFTSFYTSGYSGSERARITSSGVLDLATGSGAVGQIQFPATQVASSNANTLDDYEEGTWTPTLVASGATFTYTASRGGTYVKIGRLVFLSGVVSLASKSGGAGSSMGVGGLPFAAGAPDSNGSGQGLVFSAGIGSYTLPAGYAAPNGAVCTPNTSTAYPLLTSTLGGGSTVLNIDSLSGTGYMQFSMTYYANT
jgi:hypothetical protein